MMFPLGNPENWMKPALGKPPATFGSGLVMLMPITPTPALFTANAGKDTLKGAPGLLNRSLEDGVEAIEPRGGQACECAAGSDHVGLGRRHRRAIWFRRNIDTDLLQAARRADNLARIVYRDDTDIVRSVLHVARRQQIFGATIGGREGLARGGDAGLHDEIVGPIEPNIGEVGAGLEFLFWQDIHRGSDEDVYSEQIGRDEKGVGILACLRVIREAIHTVAARQIVATRPAVVDKILSQWIARFADGKGKFLETALR